MGTLMKDVTFLLPAYNEEKSIGILLKNINRLYPHSQVLVIDNNCDDKTPQIAREFDARVYPEKKQGKGYAIKKGFTKIETEYTVMMDADNTYDPLEAPQLLKLLKEDHADVVLGCRLNDKRMNGSITKFNLFGNHMLSFITSSFYTRISDVCTGYWAFNHKVIDYLLESGVRSNGFELEVEIFAKISNGGFKIKEIPIAYRRRMDKPKLNSLEDGIKIFKALCYHKIYG
jgi:glycosyltransferase involved in cell wall biosynthesis